MEQKYSTESLREKIKELELRQKEEGKVLKEQLAVTYENLKPVNIVKSLIGDVFESKSLREEFISSAASYTSGLLTKKLVVGNSQNPLLKIVGLGLQFGITALVTKNYDSIKGIFSQYLNAFISKLTDSINNLSFEKESDEEQKTEN